MLLLWMDGYPTVGGLSGSWSRKRPNDVLKVESLEILVVAAGIQFHKRGPITAKESSNILWALAVAPLVRTGTRTRIPRLSLELNVMFRSFGMSPFSTLNIVMMM